MKCSKCRNESLPGVANCEFCGAPLREEEGQSSPESAPSPPVEELFRAKLLEIKSAVQETFKGLNFKEALEKGKLSELFDRVRGTKILSDRMDPLTNMIIVFLVWGILNFVGFFRIAALVLAFLGGPLGIVLLLVLTYVYSTHRGVIHEKVEELRGGESLRKSR